jgi:GTP-dependent phosphoenolpyruvate carboxykinase
MMEELLAVKPEEWARELQGEKEFLESLGPKIPPTLFAQYKKVAGRFNR